MKFFRFLSLQTYTNDTNDTNDNPSVWIPPRGTSGLFLCVCQTGVHTCSTSNGISMFREGPCHVATSLCHYMPSKPHSTSMLDWVVLTRTCLNMLNWDFLNLKVVYHSYKTYNVEGKAWFSAFFCVFNSFQRFSGWWHCSSSWSRFGSSHPEDVPGRKELTWSSSLQTVWFPTCRSCRTWMNGKLVVLAVTNGSPSTSSNLFQAAKMNRS